MIFLQNETQSLETHHRATPKIFPSLVPLGTIFQVSSTPCDAARHILPSILNLYHFQAEIKQVEPSVEMFCLRVGSRS